MLHFSATHSPHGTGTNSTVYTYYNIREMFSTFPPMGTYWPYPPSVSMYLLLSLESPFSYFAIPFCPLSSFRVLDPPLNGGVLQFLHIGGITGVHKCIFLVKRRNCWEFLHAIVIRREKLFKVVQSLTPGE